MKSHSALMIALSLGWSACNSHEVARTPTPVEVTQVTSGAAEGGVRYSAAIEADRSVDLSFRTGGYVEAIAQVRGADGRMRPLQEGDRLRRGAVLARVRQADYRDKVAQGSAVIEEARAGAEQARRDYERTRALFDAQSVTRPELEAAKARYDAAAARLRNATAGARDADLAMDDSTLNAPMDGVITAKNIEVGRLVGPGITAFTLANTENVKVVFGVPDVLIPSAKVGQRLDITTEAQRGMVHSGTITRVSPSADAKARVFEVEVTIPNPDDSLKAGMVASLQLGQSSPAPQATTTIPLDAVVRSSSDRSQYAVFIVDGSGESGVARSRNVQLGDTTGNRIVVTSGLNAGDRVVTRGASLLTDGESVRVVPGSES